MKVHLLPDIEAALHLCEPCKKRTGRKTSRHVPHSDYQIVGGWVLEAPHVIEWVCKPCVSGIWGADAVVVARGHFNPSTVAKRLDALGLTEAAL